MNESLLKEYTTEEVETTLQQMAHLKAPGLDGLRTCMLFSGSLGSAQRRGMWCGPCGSQLFKFGYFL
jgi:hypothetical protein